MITIQYCPCGHVDTSSDPELIKRAAERVAKGYLDALILSSDECEECWEERRRQNALYAACDMFQEPLLA
jgi:hypothetical protein